jgi:hypothetical protein
LARKREIAPQEGTGNHWFKPRRYGDGATPIAWQGWAAIVVFLIVVPLVAFGLMWAMPNVLGILAIVIFIPLAAYGFMTFVRKKTDGEWRWRWGDDKAIESQKTSRKQTVRKKS